MRKIWKIFRKNLEDISTEFKSNLEMCYKNVDKFKDNSDIY